MSDDLTGTQNTETVNEDPTNNAATPPEDDATVDWKAKAEQYKHFMRENEKAKNAALKEIDDLKRAQMSDAEKALAEAKDAGLKEGISKVATRLVQAELKAAAASAGVVIPEGLDKFVNYTNLLGADGEPDEEAIKSLVSSFKPSDNRTTFAQGLGIGPQGGGEATLDYSPQAIAERVFKRTSF